MQALFDNENVSKQAEHVEESTQSVQTLGTGYNIHKILVEGM